MPMWLVVPLNDCHTFVLFTVFSFCTNAGKRKAGFTLGWLFFFFFLRVFISGKNADFVTIEKLIINDPMKERINDLFVLVFFVYHFNTESILVYYPFLV